MCQVQQSRPGRASQEKSSSFPSIAKHCPHQTLQAYKQMTMSLYTSGDEDHMKLYRLSRVVYSPTREEWPGEEATAEADENGEQLMCVNHSSPWIATAMRASTCQRTARVLHLCFICPCHLSVCILQSTWYSVAQSHSDDSHVYTMLTLSSPQNVMHASNIRHQT